MRIATSFSANNLFPVRSGGLFPHKLIIRASAHVRPFCNSGKKSEVQSRPEKRAARISGNIQEVHDIARVGTMVEIFQHYDSNSIYILDYAGCFRDSVCADYHGAHGRYEKML